MKNNGKVYLVGAGPGDPGLMTIRGYELLKKADVVVVDALVNTQLLKGIKAKVIYAGKRGPGAPHGSSGEPQEMINRLLVRLGKQGKRVVRLKGGDPFVFGRGSEELEALTASGINFEVVPGITSAIAAPAYAGIPVTDRRWASQVTFVTGHGQAQTRGSDPAAPAVNWGKLPKQGSLVILMGVASWKNIQKKLLVSGFPGARPVAAIESGTTDEQRVIVTTLKNSVKDFDQRRLVSPAIIVVGDVVRLASRFSWATQNKPLLGKRVVVTRPLIQSGELVLMLEQRGAQVFVSPSIKIQPLVNKILLKSRRYDGIIFLSSNAVHIFGRAAKKISFLKKTKAICVGFQTKREAEEQGWQVSKTPEKFSSAGLLKTMGVVKGKKFLVPRVQNAPRGFIESLQKRGAQVEEVVTYKTLPVAPTFAMRRVLLRGVDAVTFTSASTAESFLRSFTASQRKKIFKSARAISMGPQTSAALRAGGVKKISEAKNATLEDLLKEIF